MGQNRHSRRDQSKGRYTPPKAPRGSVEFVEAVFLDGKPIGFVVGSWCNDPECTQRHR